MTPQEELRRALSGVMELIDAGHRLNEDTPSLSVQLHRIDHLVDTYGPELPSMLRHYLERRSYTKALNFLTGRDETI